MSTITDTAFDAIMANEPPPTPSIEESLANIANHLGTIANRLERWDNGGGINIVPGVTLTDQLDTIGEQLRGLR